MRPDRIIEHETIGAKFELQSKSLLALCHEGEITPNQRLECLRLIEKIDAELKPQYISSYIVVVHDGLNFMVSMFNIIFNVTIYENQSVECACMCVMENKETRHFDSVGNIVGWMKQQHEIMIENNTKKIGDIKDV